MSPGKLQNEENEKLDKISAMSNCIIDLKKHQAKLVAEKDSLVKEKCLRLKKMRMEEHKQKTSELDEKERELCRQTNQLVDDFINTSDNTPFHNALVHILGNLKGTLKNTIKCETLTSREKLDSTLMGGNSI